MNAIRPKRVRSILEAPFSQSFQGFIVVESEEILSWWELSNL